MTEVNATGTGFLFVGPNEQASPTTSSLYFPTGDVRASGVSLAIKPSQSTVSEFETSYAYDANGNVVTTIADAGTGGIAATFTTTYNLAGKPVTASVYPNAGGGGTARITTTFYDSAGHAAGTQNAIAPTGGSAPTCPSTTSTKCNTVLVFDMEGRVTETSDAYAVRAHVWYDMGAHPVRSAANYVPGGDYTNVQNLVTDTRYDVTGRPVAATSYLVNPGQSFTDLSSAAAYVANTAYDAIGRSTSVIKPDSSWVHSVYTKGGRIDRTSRPGSASQGDGDVAWTRNVYDAASRQIATISDYDTSGAAGMVLTGFETDSSGWDAGGSGFLSGGPDSVKIERGTGSTVHSGTSSLQIGTGAAANQGAEWLMAGSFNHTHTYSARLWVNAPSGVGVKTYLGVPGGSNSNTTITGSGSWQQVNLTWTPGADTAANTVLLAVASQSASATTFRVDDVTVWDTTARSAAQPNPANVLSSATLYDANGQVVTSVITPHNVGDPAPVTTSLYDVMGRVTRVTVNANLSVSGNGPNNDTNLITGYTYDSLGRKTDVTDPADHVSHASYDRLGRVTSGVTDYGTGHLAITAIAAYDALGEAIATCSPDAVVAGCNSSNITTSSLAWHYAYDLMGRVATATPPVNVGTQLVTTTTNYETGGRLSSVVESVGANTIRSSSYGYDDAGRQTTTAVTVGSSTLTTTLTLDSLSRQTQIATSGTSSDTLSGAYDPTGRLYSISRGGATLTSYAYNADGTASSRTDNGSATSTFGYTTLGQLRTAGLPGSTSASFTWALDGTMAARTWGTYISGAYAYDGAKRPTGLTISRSGAATSDTIARTYDVVGNVTSESQVLGGVTGAGKTVLAGSQTQSFIYDAAGRLTNSVFSGSITEARTYVYDADGNRTSVTEAGVTTYYAYDRTDGILWKGPNQNGSGSSTFVYDSLGQLVSSYPSVPDASGTVPTTYAYDPAGHLTQITAGGHVSAFGIDALGRHASVSVDGGAVTTYTYLGMSNTVAAQTTSGNTLYSGIDAIGDRITTTEGAASVYVIADLHGNVTATADTTSGPNYLSAYRYDAYGETCAAYLAGSLSSDSNPWRFQGRILQSTSGQTDLYDFGARSYDPSLGAFTSFDSVAGSAQNPITLNRYLYALGNPETLVDPDGHLACGGGLDPLSAAHCEAINAPAVAAARQSVQCGGGLPPSMAQQCETHKQEVVSKARATAGTGPTLKETWERQQEEKRRQQAEEERARAAAAAAAAAAAEEAKHHCDFGLGCIGAFAQGAANGALNYPGDIARSVTGAVNAVTDCVNGNCSLTPGQVFDAYVSFVTDPTGLMHAGQRAGEAAHNGDWYAAGQETGRAAVTVAIAVAGAAAGKGLTWLRGLRGAGEAAEAADAGDAAAAAAGACSFTATTAVATADGSTAIASLHAGDTVEAYDPRTGETGPHTVTAVMVNPDPATEHLVLDSGAVDTTPNHPFFTTHRGWVNAGDLKIGEKVRTATGSDATVVSFTVDDHSANMWDITVDGAHSFFVGSGRVLVHNCPIAGPGTGRPYPPNLPGDQLPGARPPVPTTELSPEARALTQLGQDTGDIGNIAKDIAGEPVVPAGATVPQGATGKLMYIARKLLELGGGD
jgi:RHS repeat-associated protein